MSYFKIEPRGISVVHEDNMIPDLLCRLKTTLILGYDHKSMYELCNELYVHVPWSKKYKYENTIADSISTYMFRSNPDYRHYLGMKLSCAYVHRVHTGDLILKIGARVRER